ncbi:MAG TPA: hypothetical protein VFV87_05380 [Pirellulaceae bacterium]|nr:hypothetical protein [Pirellulaceae bacterium]
MIDELAANVRRLGVPLLGLPDVPRMNTRERIRLSTDKFDEHWRQRHRDFHAAIDFMQSAIQSVTGITTHQHAPASAAVPSKRGRRGPEAVYDYSEDVKLLQDWQAAKRQGASRKEFCRERNRQVKELTRAQTRHRARQQKQKRSNSRVKSH